jgi:hypothetical protein
MRRLSVLAVCLFVLGSVSAQKMVGSISALKGQKEVNLVLDMSKMLVNGKAESAYIAEETKGKSKAEKEQWISEWNEKMRADAYSMLAKDLDKAVKDKWFSVGDYPEAEYTITVKIADLTTGFFAGPFQKPSALKGEIRFAKTNGKTSFATAEFKKVSSKISGTIPYFVTRIAMSFGTLGDNIAKMINKNLKK